MVDQLPKASRPLAQAQLARRSITAKVFSIELSACGQVYQPNINSEKNLVARDFANSKKKKQF